MSQARASDHLDLLVGERRRHPRYAECTGVLFLEVGGSGGTTAGRLQDLSAGGLCLVTPRAVAVGAELYLGIFFRSPRHDPLVVVAKVVRCTPGDGRFALGLRFVRNNAAQRAAFKAVQQRLRDRHGP